VLTKEDVVQLQDAAEAQLRKRAMLCRDLYRNKPRNYFDELSSERDGIMKSYLKDASGDLRSPINGEIFGLFFCANVTYSGYPFPKSPFGDTRLLIRTEEVLELTPNMFFADFYCMKNEVNRHHVTIVLTKSDSSADQFCKKHLPKLDLHRNPFLYKDDEGQFMVSLDIFVDVFVTEDLNVKNMLESKVCKIEYNIETTGRGQTSQGGHMGEKSKHCENCNIFACRIMAVNAKNDEVY